MENDVEVVDQEEDFDGGEKFANLCEVKEICYPTLSDGKSAPKNFSTKLGTDLDPLHLDHSHIDNETSR